MALFCVSYRAEHYDNNPAFSLGCEFVEAPEPRDAFDGEAIADKAVAAVRKKRENAARNFLVKDVWVTGVQRLDNTSAPVGREGVR